MLEIKQLHKGYDGRPLLRDVNLSVHRGEIHGLIGSNGAGKTTLLKCAVGIYRPASGNVTYDDQAIYDCPAVKTKVAYVSEQLEFVNLYTVTGLAGHYQNFYDTFSMEKFKALNQRFGLHPRKNIGTLSKGQRAKLHFMLALAQNPEYLIMDEPESGMDAESRRLFRDILIEEVEAGQIGVLFSSHDLTDVEKLCDTVSMIENGELFASKSVDEFAEGAQKWKAVLPAKIADEALYAGTIHRQSSIGTLSEFYTLGDFSENEKLLETLGFTECTAQQISLEEIYSLLKEQNLQEKGGNDHA